MGEVDVTNSFVTVADLSSAKTSGARNMLTNNKLVGLANRMTELPVSISSSSIALVSDTVFLSDISV